MVLNRRTSGRLVGSIMASNMITQPATNNASSGSGRPSASSVRWSRKRA
jgi:hypothetical protein